MSTILDTCPAVSKRLPDSGGARFVRHTSHRPNSSTGQTRSANHTTASTTTNAQRPIPRNTPAGKANRSWPGQKHTLTVSKTLNGASHTSSPSPVDTSANIVNASNVTPPGCALRGAVSIESTTPETRCTSTSVQCNDAHATPTPRAPVHALKSSASSNVSRGFVFTVDNLQRPWTTLCRSFVVARTTSGTSALLAKPATARRAQSTHRSSSHHRHCDPQPRATSVVPSNNTRST